MDVSALEHVTKGIVEKSLEPKWLRMIGFHAWWASREAGTTDGGLMI
jgi:hypothetical protein